LNKIRAGKHVREALQGENSLDIQARHNLYKTQLMCILIGYYRSSHVTIYSQILLRKLQIFQKVKYIVSPILIFPVS